jgi:hypothetical protein
VGLRTFGRLCWISYFKSAGKNPVPSYGWAGSLLYTLDPQIVQKALIGDPYLGLAYSLT